MGLIAQRYSSETGVLEKHEPLPIGRYWIDIFEDGVAAWVGWSGGNLATVQVEKTEFYKGQSKIAEILGYVYLPEIILNQMNGVAPDRAWIIFNVTAPTPWGIQDKIGWPNIAGKDVHTSDDTVQKPNAKDTLPWYLGGTQDDNIPAWAKVAVVGGVLAVGIWGIASIVKSFR